MAKISELSDGGSLLPTDYLIAVRSGGNVKVQADTINVDQIDLGDNEKIRLGNSQDLQIYHDGIHSYVSDQGTGSLFLQSGNTVFIQNSGGTANYFKGTDGGAAELFHSGSSKLATTSTGIDVTGTVTADGLTVDSSSGITVNGPTDQDGKLNLVAYAGVQNAEARIQAVRGNTSGTDSRLQFLTNNGTSLLTRVDIDDNGDISFYEDTGTTAKLFWDASAESLGIGTTSPSSVLTAVTSSNANNIQIRRDSTTTSDYAQLGFSVSTGTTADNNAEIRAIRTNSPNVGDTEIAFLNRGSGVGPTEHLRITSAGNVTINSSGTIPTGVLLGRQLVVGSTTGSEIIAFREDTDVAVGDISGALLIGNSDIDGVEDHFVGMWGKVSSTNGSQDLHFAAGRSGYESDTPQMTLDSSGQVGIGTSSPSSTLHISSSTPKITLTDSGVDRTSEVYAASDNLVLAADTGNAGADSHIRFEVDTQEKMRIDSGGRLLVSETTNLGTRFVIEAGNSAAAEGALFGLLTVGRSGSGYPIVGYNCEPTTTALTYNRHSNDYASWVDFLTGQVRTFTTTSIGTGTTTGTAGPYVAGGGTSWTSSSDQRFKDNVQGITYGLDAVKSLNPVSYVRNDRDTGETELGFIAQEVESVVQEVVNVDPDGYYGLNYERLIPVLTKAIQEQQDLIESLTARIAALEGAN